MSDESTTTEIVVVAIWPDGTWCQISELDAYLTWMSDDYVRVEVGEWVEDGSPADKYFDFLREGPTVEAR